jgi:PEGA domain-containing protein
MTDQGSLDMLRRLAMVAACVLLLGAIPTGSLYVTTLPSGADVWVDGAYVGRSPLVVGALTPGRHAVGLTKSGWTPLQLDVTVEAGQATLSSTRLEATKTRVRPPKGSIAIHGAPAERVYLDGVPAVPAKDGTIPAAAGLHEIAFRTPRGRIARSVMVWPQTRTDVVFQPDVEVPRPSVVAPAEDYVPRSAIRVDGDKVVVRYGEHLVVGHIGVTTYRVDGKSVDYGEAPTMIGGRLYLPLDLLTSLFSGTR